jgi:FXSXX-COOH protein
MQDDPPVDEEDVLWSELPRLSDLRLADLAAIPSSALVESVRRILDESGKQPTTYSQYQAVI